MDLLQSVALVLGLLVAIIFALLFGTIGLELLIRFIRHWDTRKEPPNIIRGKFMGMEWEVEAQLARTATETLARHQDQLDRMDKGLFRLLLKVAQLEHQLPKGPQ